MAYIVIAYSLININGEEKRLYLDDTEKYFESLDINDAKEYITYLINKGYIVDSSPINILKQGDINVEEMYRFDALAKLTPEEKQALGI